VPDESVRPLRHLTAGTARLEQKICTGAILRGGCRRGKEWEVTLYNKMKRHGLI